MRGPLDQILQKFGIDYVLRPYETMPFDYFNAEKGIDIMAEVSLAGDKRALTVAIQKITHTPGGDLQVKQVYTFQANLEPGDVYMAKQLRILDKDMTEKFNWFENGCRFFKQCTALIKKNTAPDFDAIFKATFGDAAGGDSQGEAFSGGTGSRNFKNDKPAPLPPKPPGKL